MSFTYFPIPIKGGNASIRESPQISCTYRDVQYEGCVTKFHLPSWRTTELYRIAAIAIRVYKELMPEFVNKILMNYYALSVYTSHVINNSKIKILNTKCNDICHM